MGRPSYLYSSEEWVVKPRENLFDNHQATSRCSLVSRVHHFCSLVEGYSAKMQELSKVMRRNVTHQSRIVGEKIQCRILKVLPLEGNTFKFVLEKKK